MSPAAATWMRTSPGLGVGCGQVDKAELFRTAGLEDADSVHGRYDASECRGRREGAGHGPGDHCLTVFDGLGSGKAGGGELGIELCFELGVGQVHFAGQDFGLARALVAEFADADPVFTSGRVGRRCGR